MYNQPVEDFIQYTDRNGKNYIASKPNDLEPWFNDMINRYGLETLCNMFPYVTLVLDTNTGMLQTWVPCKYNAKVTNAFHILLAQKLDERYVSDNQEEFALDLEKYYPKKDKVEDHYIEYDMNTVLETDKDRYNMDLMNMPEYITIASPPPNSHPNKDARGNYRTPNSQVNYMGYYNYSNPYSYLPQYQTFQQFPIITT